MQESDVELVEAVLAGASERFGELVRRYDRRVRSALAERLGTRRSFEELVHQTFYRAFMNLGQLGDPARFEGWLLRIAARCAADHLRARSARRERPLPESEAWTAAPAPMDEPRAWIWDEVERLAPAFAEVLVLRYRAGLSYGEIAARLALPLSTVRGRIYEARRALRQRLALDPELGGQK
jgi:RNA polymerase sigma-70 factor (ECF subfamily)